MDTTGKRAAVFAARLGGAALSLTGVAIGVRRPAAALMRSFFRSK